MEYNGEDIRKAQMEQRQRILKSFGETNLFSGEGDSNKLMRSMEKAEENDIEKAKHQDGDMHPNGRWVWRQSANGGKGDWRVANPKRGGGSRAAASSSKTTSSSSDSKKLIGFATVSEVKGMIKMMNDFANGADWTEENERKAKAFLRLIPQEYCSSDKNIINRMNKTLVTLKKHFPELLKSNKVDNDSKTTSSEGNETTQKTSSTPKKTNSKKKDDDSAIASELKKELDKNAANSEKSIAKIFEKIDGINFKKNFDGETEAVVGEYDIKAGGSASYLRLEWDSGLRTTLNHVGNQGVAKVHNGAMVLKIQGGYDLHRITLSGKSESELKDVIELVTKIKNLKRKDLLSIPGTGEKDKLTKKVKEIINDYNKSVSKTTASKKTDSKKIGKTDVDEVKSMVKWIQGKNGMNWTYDDANKAIEFLQKVPAKYRSNDRNVINRMRKTLYNLQFELSK